VLTVPAAAQSPHGPGTRTAAGAPAGTPPASTRPRAWILVDADRGTVLDAGNDRVLLPPASLTKLLTALVAAHHLAPTDTLTVSERAAGEPASKINMKAGQVWTFQDALYSLLVSSANDAAVAIAERVSGSAEAFAAELGRAADELGLQDAPVLRDPAGLDDNFSVAGGNLLSARDLAIVARAALAQPLLAQVVAAPVYPFTGPDGAHHRLGNHNLLLTTYPGAIGEKTGYTRKSGEDLIAAARRNGRTILAVVLGAPNVWQNTADLLDEGFALGPSAAGTGDTLPAVHLPGQIPVLVPVPPAATTGAPPVGPARARAGGGRHGVLPIRNALLGVGLVGAGSVGLAARRRQVLARRRRRSAALAHLRPRAPAEQAGRADRARAV